MLEATHVRAEGIRHVAPYGWKADPKLADWACDVWSVTLTYQGRSYTTEYRTGIGHRKRSEANTYRDHTSVKIEAKDVLSCLFLDASSAAETFEDWCGNTGLDTDSRKALATYLECQQTATALRRLFGADYAKVEEECRDA